MATRAEVINRIRQFNDVEELGDGAFKVVMDWTDGRSQLVYLFVLDVWIQFDSPFAHVDDITSTKALELNKSVFGVGRQSDLYTLRGSLLIEDIDESELIGMGQRLAEMADSLEEQVGGDRF